MWHEHQHKNIRTKTDSVLGASRVSTGDQLLYVAQHNPPILKPVLFQIPKPNFRSQQEDSVIKSSNELKTENLSLLKLADELWRSQLYCRNGLRSFCSVTAVNQSCSVSSRHSNPQRISICCSKDRFPIPFNLQVTAVKGDSNHKMIISMNQISLKHFLFATLSPQLESHLSQIF